jgi:Fe-S cluster biosynthesis and repair protein YggX
LSKAPFGQSKALASIGDEILKSTCAECYRAWVESSVRVINELRLDLRDPQGQHIWTEQMRTYLNLGGVRDAWARFLDRRVRVETVRHTIAVATLIAITEHKLTLTDFADPEIPEGFKSENNAEIAREFASGSASVLRDDVLTIESAESA